MPSKGDREFGQKAVKNGFAAQEDIKRALQEQSRYEKEGALTTLDRLVVEMGIMNPFQVEFLQEDLKRKVLFCPGCMAKYNVYKYPGGSRVTCRKCGEDIDVPKRFSEMDPEERRLFDEQGKPKYETTAFINKVIGGYRIIEELGSGEMGVTFKARQLSLDRVVALKVLPMEMTRDKDSVDRFLKEAKSAGKLQHPNIVQVYDIGETGGLYYYSMEFVVGHRLAKLLEDGKAYDLGETIRIVIQISKALAHAHRYGILHRDIHPESILINEEGVAKLAELGLTGGAERHGVWGLGAVSGSPSYLSPEQLANAKTASVASDVYSLGALFYRMASGRDPYPGPKVLDVMRAILKDEAPPPHEVNADIPEELSAIISRMMARNIEQRYHSADDVLEALNQFVAKSAASGRQAKKDRRSSRKWSLGRKNRKES